MFIGIIILILVFIVSIDFFYQRYNKMLICMDDDQPNIYHISDKLKNRKSEIETPLTLKFYFIFRLKKIAKAYNKIKIYFTYNEEEYKFKQFLILLLIIIYLITKPSQESIIELIKSLKCK